MGMRITVREADRQYGNENNSMGTINIPNLLSTKADPVHYCPTLILLITYTSGPFGPSHAVVWLYVVLERLRPRVASSELLQSASQKLDAMEAPFIQTKKRMVMKLKK